ncbi:MAG: ABC transporter permease [candidate division Zixibacteria bacterium]|nr:ABC transporter permease [candidate division Zixibacteria bacterium]
MIWYSLLKEAIAAIWVNRLRSFLTMLGMAMGVTAVIAIVSIVEGMQQEMEHVFKSMGQNTFMATRFGIVTSWNEYEKKRRRRKITRELIAPIKAGCDACDDVGAEGYARANAKYESIRMRRVYIEGHTSNLLSMKDMDVAQGRYLSEEDERRSSKVAFIGQDIVEKLFDGTDPLGKTIRLDNYKFTIIGVSERIGALFGNSQDAFIYMPLSTMQKLFKQRGNPINLIIKAVSAERRDEAMDQVRVVMRSNRHVAYEDEDDFELLSPEAILGFINDITKAFRSIIIALPALSIIIGGIVIMNIMMVSVTERTREIGVRKSVGAKRSHISAQFLYESLIQSLLGGGVGILLGIGIGRFFLGKMQDVPTDPTGVAIFLGFGIALVVGLFFGIYPAMRAARLDPIKALSYE